MDSHRASCSDASGRLVTGGAGLDTGGGAAVLVRLRLIGQMDAWTVTGAQVLPHGRKTRGLLAAIALSGPRPAARARLAELIWSGRPEEQARASLRQELHRLQEALAPAGQEVLRLSRDHISFVPGRVWVDANEVMGATVHDPDPLWLMAGELLEDLDGLDPAFDAWLAAERERLRDRARDIAEGLLPGDAEPSAVILAAKRVLQIDRTHEGAWRALMRAYADSGERGLAVQAYDRCKATLADLLDTEPSVETRALLADIRGTQRGVKSQPGAAHARAVAAPAEPHMARTVPDAASAIRRGFANDGDVRVGVVPMACITLTGPDAWFGQFLADEIASRLSRFRWMTVVSPASFQSGGKTVPGETMAGLAPGLDFVLDGTVQPAGGNLRVSLKLMDRRAGGQVVWSRRFDRRRDDLLAIEDEIGAEVAAQVETEMVLIETRRAAMRTGRPDTARGILFGAINHVVRLERDNFMRAGDALEQAVARAPDDAAAHSWYALWQMLLVGQHWTGDPAGAIARCGDLARRAIAIDPADALAFAVAGHAQAFLRKAPRDAAALHDHALTLNPDLAIAWALSGLTSAYLGDLAGAEQRLQRGKTLSPQHPLSFMFDTGIGMARMLAGDDRTAIAMGRKVTQLSPFFSAAYKPYLAALGHVGDRREIETTLRRLMKLEPGFTVERFLDESPSQLQSHRDRYAEGLYRAGVPRGK